MHTLPDLPNTVAREIYAHLCATLPPPPADTSPEALAARYDHAMDAVAALRPGDVFQARFAADIVAVEAWATDCLRLAGKFHDNPGETMRCRAQATAMFRQLRCLLHEYRSMRADRDQALADLHPAAMERAGYWFRATVVPEPAPVPMPQPAPPDPAPSAPAPSPHPFEGLTEIEQYAVVYPGRAARIRAEGGLPADLEFAPPEPDIVEGLLAGTSPILRALDRAPPAAAAA